jgi:AcrR family transcriptional regulator
MWCVTNDADGPVRGRPRSEKADQAIAGATLELLLEVGYASLTMAGVAQRAGVSTATLYRRYPGKRQLVTATIATLRAEKIPATTGSLEGDIRAIVDVWLDMAKGPIGLLIRSLVGEIQSDDELGGVVREHFSQTRGEISRVILDAAVERGEIRPVADPTVVLDMIIGPFLVRQLLDTKPMGPDEAEQVVGHALALLGAPGATPGHAPVA